MIYPLNTFKLSIKNDGNSKETPEYYINLIIDGNEFLEEIDEEFNVVYLQALMESTTQSGNYLIFTCSCGIADCGGWNYVKVTHSSNKVIWKFKYEIEYFFEFDLKKYITEIKRFESEIISKDLTLEPIVVVGPE